MTEPIAMDALDSAAARAFPGYLVRKDLVRRYARQYPVPTYVVEFLLGRYCASVDEKEIEEGLAIVEKQLQGRTVRTSDQEVFKSRAREEGSVKLIDLVRARLDARNDCYVAELPSLNLGDVQIADGLVKSNERMLTDGFYAEVALEYDPLEAQEKQGRPFRIASLRPIQMSKPDVLDVLARGRAGLSTGEWRDFLIRSIGLEPTFKAPYLDQAEPGDLSFVRSQEFVHKWAPSRASVALVTRGIELEPGDGRALVFVDNADAAVAMVLQSAAARANLTRR